MKRVALVLTAGLILALSQPVFVPKTEAIELKKETLQQVRNICRSEQVPSLIDPREDGSVWITLADGTLCLSISGSRNSAHAPDTSQDKKQDIQDTVGYGKFLSEPPREVSTARSKFIDLWHKQSFPDLLTPEELKVLDALALETIQNRTSDNIEISNLLRRGNRYLWACLPLMPFLSPKDIIDAWDSYILSDFARTEDKPIREQILQAIRAIKEQATFITKNDFPNLMSVTRAWIKTTDPELYATMYSTD